MKYLVWMSFWDFLGRRYQIINSINVNISPKFNRKHSKSFFVKANIMPKMCIARKTQPHPFYHYDKFKNMKLPDRINIMKENKLCYNHVVIFAY